MKWFTLLLTVVRAAGKDIPHNELPDGSSFGIAGEDATFDYIVIGGGTAGLTIATRLAEDRRYSVAVLEAGGFAQIDNGNRSQIPGYAASSSGTSLEGVNPSIDWRFVTTPQVGAGNKSIHYTRGKTLGGSSARHSLTYNRATVGSFQQWADEVDDQSWTWKNIYKYYERSTRLDILQTVSPSNVTWQYNTDDFKRGPIHVSWPQYVTSIASWASKALDEFGINSLSHNMAGGALLGWAYVLSSMNGKTQTRSHAGNSYLSLALKQTQLIVYTRAFVTRILFDGDKRARSVIVETDGVQYTISANREIMLSAGTFQSPQLLMVSGIGPASTLRTFDIPIVADRPGVGQNMQDNPLYGITFPVDLETASSYTTNPERIVDAIYDYNKYRTEFLTSPQSGVISFFKASHVKGVLLSAQARKDLSSFADDWPDFQVLTFSAYLGPVALAPQTDKLNYASLIGAITAVMSRGSITITSSNMHDNPVIDPGWLTHSTDQEVAVASIKLMRDLVKTKALSSILAGPETFPGLNVTTDADILSAIQSQAITWYHAAGTCKIGRKDDPMAVVDSKGRVLGVQALRVVDLSIVPRLPPGQPQATVYLIGEKIADEILRKT